MKIDRIALLFAVLGFLVPAGIFIRICRVEKNTYNFWSGNGELSFFALANFCLLVFVFQFTALILALFKMEKPAAQGAVAMVCATPLLMILVWNLVKSWA